MPDKQHQLPESLRLQPWWIVDPPIWLFEILDEAAQREIAGIHFELQKTVFQAYAQAAERMGAIAAKGQQQSRNR